MGTWGSGNFENDGACDYRDSIASQLIAKIEACFATESASDLDEGGEAELMPNVAMLAVLCAHCEATPPHLNAVRDWHERYIHIYDEQIDDLAPDPAYKSERRQIINATFEQLEAQAHAFWSDHGGA